MSEQPSFHYPVEVFDENLPLLIAEGSPIFFIQEDGSRIRIGTVGAIEKIENGYVVKGAIHE